MVVQIEGFGESPSSELPLRSRTNRPGNFRSLISMRLVLARRPRSVAGGWGVVTVGEDIDNRIGHISGYP